MSRSAMPHLLKWQTWGMNSHNNTDSEITELTPRSLTLDEIERLGKRLSAFYERSRRHLRTTSVIRPGQGRDC